jgi:hypothetical protein
MRRIFAIFITTIVLFSTSCSSDSDKSGTSEAANPFYNSKSVPVAEFSGEWIVPWMEVLYKHFTQQFLSPPVAARIYGYMGIAYYEAMIGGMPNYQSFEGQIRDYKDVPRSDKNQEYDWPTVMTETGYLVVDEMLSRSAGATDMKMKSLYQKQIAERKAKIAADVLERSQAYGKKLAHHIIDYSRKDNYEETRNNVYKVPSRDGHPELWEPTDFNQAALEPYWGDLRPFVLDAATDCSIEMPFEYSSEEGSEFWKACEEVYEIDQNLTEEQRNIALYWADCPGETSTPSGHWAFIMNNVVKGYGLNLETAAEVYGLTGIAMADAFISCWDSKYIVNLVRPKTYIQENFGDPGWEPYVETPPFPEYTSGHSNVSASAATVLTSLLGVKSFIDSTHTIIGLEPRSFESFDAAAKEAAFSRMYGGIHYEIAISLGLDQGKCVGQMVLDRVKLKIEPKMKKTEASL